MIPKSSACKQMEFGIQALFGPSDPLLGAHIQSICEALDIPHVEARLDFEPTFKEFSINLHPSQEHMNHAFKDLMTFLNWTKVAIVYEEDYGTFYSICKSLFLSYKQIFYFKYSSFYKSIYVFSVIKFENKN